MRRWGQAATGTWHLAYDVSATYWVAECRGWMTLRSHPIELNRNTLRAQPLEPTCQRGEKIAAAYRHGTER